jgi:hypothetical protein
MAYIEKHNAEFKRGIHTFYLGSNKYADLTNQEFVAIYNGYNATLKGSSKAKSVFTFNPKVQVPDSVGKKINNFTLFN